MIYNLPAIFINLTGYVHFVMEFVSVLDARGRTWFKD